MRLDKTFRIKMHVRLAELKWTLPEFQTHHDLTKEEAESFFYGKGGSEKDSFVSDESYRKAVTWLEG